MKVLHLHNLHRFRGGADTAALRAIELLRARGLDVETLILDSRDLPSGLRGKVTAFASGIYAHAALRRLELLLDAFRPDVVHAHKLYPMISPWALRVCDERGFPVVMSVYDYQLTCPVATHVWQGTTCTRCCGGREHWGVIRNCRGRLLESIAYAARHAVARQYRFYGEHVARFVTPTRFASSWLAERAGVPEERLRTIPFSLELPATSADAGQGTYIAYAGRFAPEKGLGVLIEAARRTGLPFRLAGDEARLPIADRVPNVGLITTRNRGELIEFYRGARALVVPSLWFETFPLVIGEAMSHGIPVIASRIGGLPEIVRDGVNGLLVEPGDAADLARKATMLWNDPRLAQRLGAEARAYIRSTCNDQVFVEQLLAVYAEVRA